MKFLIFFAIVLIASAELEFNIPQESLNGQVALVTGGSSGIGYETALLFARKGASVVFCARDKHPTWYNGSSAQKSINEDAQVKQAGGQALFFKADVTVAAEVRNLIDYAHNIFGRIDYAIFNAGISGFSGKIHDLPEDTLKGEKDPMFTNLYGGVICVKSITQYWTQYGNPNSTYSIVMLSSFFGFRGSAQNHLYAASKHGINGIVKSVALNYATTSPKIRINAIAPGLTNTYMVRNSIKPDYDSEDAVREDDPRWLAALPLWESTLPNKRIAHPSEQAEVIYFLASNKASYVTGAIINVDSGLSDR